MKIKCCGIWQSTNDVEDYIFFDKYITKPFLKQMVRDFKVTQEEIYCHSCKICGALTVNVIRRGKMLGKKAILEVEEFKGENAINFLTETANKRFFVEIPNPAKPPVYYSKFIPLVYGKKVDAFTQRKRYLNESDWADKVDGYKKQIKIKSDAFGSKKQIVEKNANWVSDVFKSEVKVYKLEEKKIISTKKNDSVG